MGIRIADRTFEEGLDYRGMYFPGKTVSPDIVK